MKYNMKELKIYYVKIKDFKVWYNNKLSDFLILRSEDKEKLKKVRNNILAWARRNNIIIRTHILGDGLHIVRENANPKGKEIVWYIP